MILTFKGALKAKFRLFYIFFIHDYIHILKHEIVSRAKKLYPLKKAYNPMIRKKLLLFKRLYALYYVALSKMTLTANFSS